MARCIYRFVHRHINNVMHAFLLLHWLFDLHFLRCKWDHFHWQFFYSLLQSKANLLRKISWLLLCMQAPAHTLLCKTTHHRHNVSLILYYRLNHAQHVYCPPMLLPDTSKTPRYLHLPCMCVLMSAFRV